MFSTAVTCNLISVTIKAKATYLADILRKLQETGYVVTQWHF